MKRWIGLCLLACACGGSNGGNGNPDSGTPHGSGSFTGTVNGHSLTVKDAVFGDPSSALVAVVAADQNNLCTLLGGTTFPGGTVTVLGIAIVNTNTMPAGPVTTGTYSWFDLQGGGSLPTGLIWDGAFALPTDCEGNGEAWLPSGGTVMVTQMGNTTGTHLKATYSNLTFDGGVGGLSGSVEATYCPAATIAPNCGRLLLARPPASE